MRVYLSILLLLSGCAAELPPRPVLAPASMMMPAPIHFCQTGQTEHCRKFSATDVTGTVTRGHGEESE